MAQNINRRELLQKGTLAGLSCLSTTGFSYPSNQTLSESRQGQDHPPLLFVFCANGGASIIDSFLPVIRTNKNKTLNAYPDSMIESIKGSSIRCVTNIPYRIQLPVGPHYSMKDFLIRHFRDILVLTQEGSSVNHFIAAKRALNGNQINQGRTLAEAYAVRYGKQFLLPNINMSLGGYVEPGGDPSLPAYARQEVVVDANLFSFSTHGYQKIAEQPEATLIEKARDVRQRLESASVQRFQQAQVIQDFLQLRNQIPLVESKQLIDALSLLGSRTDLLEKNPLLGKILEVFPDLQTNPLHAKVSLAYLLAHYGISGSMTISMADQLVFNAEEPPSRIESLPLGFDWSHTDHRGAQNTMWRTLLQAVDGLIQLLKQVPYRNDETLGSLWDHSLIYIATEFGRTRDLSRGSGHDLNNGNLLISPLLKGNQILGGVHPETLQTYGFDPVSGKEDPQRKIDEGDIYSIICQALGIDFEGRRSFPIVSRLS